MMDEQAPVMDYRPEQREPNATFFFKLGKSFAFYID
jgi:hypothetical protein